MKPSVSILWKKGEFYLNMEKKLRKRQVYQSSLQQACFVLSSICSFYLRCNEDSLCPEPDNLYFNPFYNESFSDAEDERDPDENFFNKVNTQNFQCSYLFSNVIHVNIRSLS